MTLDAIARNVLYETPMPEEGGGRGLGSCGSCGPYWCCYISCGGGGGGNGDSCAIVILTLTILAAAAAFFVSLGITIGEGATAEKYRLHIKEIKKCEASETQNNLLILVKDKYHSASVNTLSLSIATVGFGLLTAAAILALYIYIEKIGFNGSYGELAKNLALTGGATVGVGFLSMGTYQAIRLFHNQELANLRKDLMEQFPKNTK